MRASSSLVSHHQQTNMVQAPQDSCDEGTTKPIPLRRLKRFGLGPQILKRLYSCTIESILTGCITAWYGNCSAPDRKALQSVVSTDPVHHRGQASCHPGPLYQDSSHPSHRLFSLLLHGKRYWSAKSRSMRLLNSFYPRTIRLLNS